MLDTFSDWVQADNARDRAKHKFNVAMRELYRAERALQEPMPADEYRKAARKREALFFKAVQAERNYEAATELARETWRKHVMTRREDFMSSEEEIREAIDKAVAVIGDRAPEDVKRSWNRYDTDTQLGVESFWEPGYDYRDVDLWTFYDPVEGEKFIEACVVYDYMQRASNNEEA